MNTAGMFKNLQLAFLLGLGIQLAACNSQEATDSIVGAAQVAQVASTPAPLHAQLITATSGLPFGITSVGVPVSIPVTLINSGTDLTILANFAVVASTGASSAVTLTSDLCSGVALTSGSSCTFTANFSPAATGTFAGYLNLTYAGSASGESHGLTIPYTGSGIQAQPVIASAPASWDFGTIATSLSSSKTLTISNSSSGNAVFQAAQISGSGYSITTDGCNSSTLTSATTCTITVQFAPLIPGSSLGLLTLNYQNLVGTPSTKTISLSGIGNIPQPALTLSPSPQNFGSVATNAYSNQVITVSNNTTVSATIGTPSVSGSGYTITTNTCASSVLGASANCTITVRFTPAGLGAVAGTLTVPFTSSQGISYTATDTLGGTGVNPTVAFSFTGFTGVPSTDSAALNATGVTLQWTAQTAASYYRVTRTGGSTGTVVTPNLAPTSTATYAVSGLTPNTTYQFKVNAFDSGDNSDGNANWVSITTPNVTGALFMGWSDVVGLGSVYTDIGTVDNTMGLTGTNRMERNLSAVYAFDSSGVDTSTGIITVANLVPTGQAVTLRSDGTAPGGLTLGTVYYAINQSSTSLKLATTYANALAGTAISITTVGTGNMTLMPGGVVKLGWEQFSFTPTGTATGYNIYRATSLAGTYSKIGASTGQSYVDYQVSDQTNYYYKIYPVISGTEIVPSSVSDSVITVFVPPKNMSLVHRWITNREACTSLLGFSWPAGVDRSNNYSCAYTWGGGFAPNTSYSKTKWDLGYSYAIDRWQNGCKMMSYGTAIPTGGAVNDVYYYQSGTTTSNSISYRCYVKDSVSGWIPEDSSLVTSADRALLRTNFPGYSMAPLNQTQAYTSCQQRAPTGLVDGNGNSSLRLMRAHEAVLSRAVQGNNVNYRSPATLNLIFNGVNLPANGSCNTLNYTTGNFLDGVIVPSPSTYSQAYHILMNGSSLTRNCYSRYEISNLWDASNEWTSTQYYAASAGTGSFVASAIDAGDNLYENFKTDGVMAPSNAWGAYDSNTGFDLCPTCNFSIMPLIGYRTLSASTTLGSRVLNFSTIDFGNTNTQYMSFSQGSNLSGVTLGSMGQEYQSASRYQLNFTPVLRLYATWDQNAAMNNRCMGQVSP